LKRKGKPVHAVSRIQKTKLNPSKSQRTALGILLETQRRLYNRALAFKIAAYEEDKRSVKLGELKKVFITAPRAAGDAFLCACNYGISAETLARLIRAYDAFFRRVRLGLEAPGFPRFRAQGTFRTLNFTMLGNGCRWEPRIVREADGTKVLGVDGKPLTTRATGRVYVQSVGWLKCRKDRELPIGATVRNISLTLQADGWFVNVLYEYVPAPVAAKTGGREIAVVCGGVAPALYLSNGFEIAPSGYYQEGEARLAHLQRLKDRMKLYPITDSETGALRMHQGGRRKNQPVLRPSRNRAKFNRCVARQHLRIANRRKHWQRNVAKCLAEHFDRLVITDVTPPVAKPVPKPKPGEPGVFLPNGATDKADTNKKILDNAWRSLFHAAAAACAVTGTAFVPVEEDPDCYKNTPLVSDLSSEEERREARTRHARYVLARSKRGKD